MEYVSIVLNKQRARACMERLGELGVIQFEDVRPPLLPEGAICTRTGRILSPGHAERGDIKYLGVPLVGCVAFVQLQGDTSAFKRDYTEDVRVCDELEAILVYFEKEMSLYSIEPQVRSLSAHPCPFYGHLLRQICFSVTFRKGFGGGFGCWAFIVELRGPDCSRWSWTPSPRKSRRHFAVLR